ncbi:NAD(P)/FAD-dependent oxidoreductase [Roseomonas sp. AR75]|uniref:flavin monoamine oxidase family protein n=1 Tax=Roseomonas sp. AR75 TaxID=2562311 RepID=UPI0014850357|nr:NAD(P)/FAD-dependent oxidoreductase [Roseomonas sp. AR75]
MSRTPLFAALRHAVTLAAAARAPSAPPLDELADPARFGRRRLLGGAAVALLAPALPARAEIRIARRDARIAVVGAGLAGLVAAHHLAEAGGNVTLYEANTRIGGRILSGRGVVGEGTVVELGGSFINGEHADMLALAREFGLPLEDGAAEAGPPLLGTFFFAGAHRTLAEIAAESAAFLPRLEAMRALPEAAKAELDQRSAAALLDEFGVSGWLRSLLDIGLTQEMGLEPDRMSALYLVEYFAPDPARPQRGLFSSDQRFQIEGGNDRLPAAIAAKVGGRIRPGHRLVALRRRGSGYVLSFDRGTSREVTADIVVLALPATILRSVRLDIDAPPLTRRAIAELGYGTNAKLFAGLTARPWRAQGRSGECLSDLGMQTVWEDHGRPGTGAGAMTIFAGGRVGAGFGQGRAPDRARAAIMAVDAALPGAAVAFNGRTSRMNWPGNPYVGGSYSCFGPGQWMGFANAFDPVDRVIFAGEHTAEHSGYMDGAAQSGRAAAEAVARVLA